MDVYANHREKGMGFMRSISELFSIYIVVVLLGIGFYMTFQQSKFLKSVDHLIPESRFTKVVGIIYLIVGVVGGGILLWA